MTQRTDPYARQPDRPATPSSLAVQIACRAQFGDRLRGTS
jgi:hypothetical protein